MTDQKPTPETPDETGGTVEDLDITVVREPETAVYDASVCTISPFKTSFNPVNRSKSVGATLKR